VCLAHIAAGDDAFACPAAPDHLQCAACFRDYVRHCCENWFANKFPIVCPFQRCGHEVPVDRLRALVADAPADAAAAAAASAAPGGPPAASLLARFEAAQLRAALAESKTETPVTCGKCTLYTELFPKDYRQRAVRLVLAMKQWREAEAARRLAEARRLREAEELHAFREATREWLAAFDFFGEEPERVQQTARALDAIPDPPPRADGAPAAAAAAAEAKGGAAAAASDALAQPMLRRGRTVVEEFRPERDPLIGLSSLFFRCRLPGCGAAVCLRCNVLEPSPEAQERHQCRMTRVQELLAEVLDILAANASRTCPSCHRVSARARAVARSRALPPRLTRPAPRAPRPRRSDARTWRARTSTATAASGGATCAAWRPPTATSARTRASPPPTRAAARSTCSTCTARR
jgi:hypothetical protein